MMRRPSPACPRSGGRGRSWPATPMSTARITPGNRGRGSPGGGTSNVTRESKPPAGEITGRSPPVVTMDFHVTSDCNQECPYCWGPQGFEQPVGTKAALQIIDRIQQVGARRIVFTGGDPLKPKDLARLLRHARRIGLEVALSTTGDELSLAFLQACAPALDLISP